MTKLLKHNTAIGSAFITLSELSFHVVYADVPLSSHYSIDSAVQSAANEEFFGVSSDPDNWKRLPCRP